MAQIVLNSTTLFPWISHDFMTFFVSLTTQSFVKVPSSKPISSVSRAVAGTPDGNMEHFGAKPRDHRFSKQILRFFEFILGQPWFSVTSKHDMSRKVGCNLLGSPHQPFLVLSCKIAARFFPLCPNQNHWYVCIPKRSNIYIYIYILYPISYQYIVLLHPQNPGTSRLKFVVPVKMAYVGLYQLLPRTNSKSLYMNASPRPMLQSISSHTGIWPRKSQQNFTTSCSTAKTHPLVKVKPVPGTIYKQRSILQTKVKTNYILHKFDVGNDLTKCHPNTALGWMFFKYRPFLWD